MRGRYKPKVSNPIDFELDLAPMLAVMVKLVPVLLVSSAFVQMMNIETDLPQVVKEAVQREDQLPKEKKTLISLEVSLKDGFKINVESRGQTRSAAIPLKGGSLDFETLHEKLQETKAEFPETFRLELYPDTNVPYKEIVKVMDEARRSRDRNLRFTFNDPAKGTTAETDFMFPDVVFANMME